MSDFTSAGSTLYTKNAYKMFKKEYIIGFLIVVLLILGIVTYLYMLGSAAYNSNLDLTEEEEIELNNLYAFARYSLHTLSEEEFLGITLNVIENDKDREAFTFLRDQLGMQKGFSLFICNYFLAQNLQYPGNLIDLTCETPEYERSYFLPQGSTGVAIREFWDQKHHDVITKKERYYFDPNDKKLKIKKNPC